MDRAPHTRSLTAHLPLLPLQVTKQQQLVKLILKSWRGLVSLQAAVNTTGWAKEKMEMEAELRMARARAETEARRVEKVQWDTRLEAQARIAELEQALRRAELDARDTVHRVELQADERRLDEARKFQLQVSELQNELRLERLRQGGAQPDDLAQDSLAQQLAALQVCGPAALPSHPTPAPKSDPASPRHSASTPRSSTPGATPRRG